jgi:acetyl esterase/lipase
MGEPAGPLATLPVEAQRRFAAIGPVWGHDIAGHRDYVIAAYSPLVASAPRAGIDVARDVPYGSDPRQVLDVYAPHDARDADIVLFVHGGAFVRGRKSVNGAIYDNVCWWFARQGRLAINVEYRLAPHATYPAGAEDVGRAVQWAVSNAQRLGANARRVFVIGHSAGATHAATYAFDPGSPIPPDEHLAGVVLLSGRLRAETLRTNPNAAGVRAYFGEDCARYEERSPMAHADRVRVPLFVAIAEFENPHLDEYGKEFASNVAAAGHVRPRFRQVAKHNHTSIVAHFDSGEDALGLDIIDFMTHGH